MTIWTYIRRISRVGQVSCFDFLFYKQRGNWHLCLPDLLTCLCAVIETWITSFQLEKCWKHGAEPSVFTYFSLLKWHHLCLYHSTHDTIAIFYLFYKITSVLRQKQKKHTQFYSVNRSSVSLYVCCLYPIIQGWLTNRLHFSVLACVL